MNFTPLKIKNGQLNFSPTRKKNKPIKKILLLTLLLISTSLVASILFLKFQEKARQPAGRAEPLPACHTGTIPRPADPNCYVCKSGPKRGERAIAEKEGRTECEPGSFKVESTGNEFACSWCPQDAPTTLTGRGDENWTSCSSPLDGFCKSKGADCTECRDNSLRMICQCAAPTPTPFVPTPTPTTFAPTATPTEIPFVTVTPTPTKKPTPTPTKTPTPTPTKTPTPTPTKTPTPMKTPTPYPTGQPTPTPTKTPTPTPSPTITTTPAPTATNTPVPSATPTTIVQLPSATTAPTPALPQAGSISSSLIFLFIAGSMIILGLLL